jgi:hypothetical protein
MGKFYGVFTRSESDDGAVPLETLYRVEDDGPSALLWLGRYAAYRAYGNLPTGTLADVLRYLDALIEAGDISKEFRLGGLVYYVREVSEEELEKAVE